MIKQEVKSSPKNSSLIETESNKSNRAEKERADQKLKEEELKKIPQDSKEIDQIEQPQQQQIQLYIAFEDLDECEEECVSIELLNDQTNWKIQFEQLNNLRRLNKFNQDAFESKVMQQQDSLDSILQISDSIRSNLSKNALLLIQEVIQLQDFSRINELSSFNLIKKIIEKANNDKQFIRQAGKDAVEQLILSKKGFCLNSISALTSLILTNKNATIQEYSAQVLYQILNNNKHQLISQLTQDKIDILLPSLVKSIQSKRQPIVKHSKLMLTMLYEQNGISILNGLPHQEQSLVLNAINTPKNESKPSFRDFLAHKKQQQL